MNKTATYIHNLAMTGGVDAVRSALENLLKDCSKAASTVMVESGIPEGNATAARVISAIERTRYHGTK